MVANILWALIELNPSTFLFTKGGGANKDKPAPTSINVNTFGTSKIKLTNSEITEMIYKIFDLRPYSIEKNLALRNPIYYETSSYGHMGRNNEKINKIFLNKMNKEVNHKVDLFTWENLNYVQKINNYLNK